MDKLDKKAFNLMREKIVDSLEPRDLMNQFYQHTLFPDRDLEDIKEERGRIRRCEKLLDIIAKSKRRNIFDIFCGILEENYLFLSTPLRETRKGLQESGDPVCLLDNLSKERRKSRPTEQELMQVATNLGKEWKDLALRLGFNNAGIYKYQQSHPHNITYAINDMLVAWLRAKYAEATIESLITHLEACGIDDDVLSQMFPSVNG